jgi:ankyrin repeat protein
LGKMDPEMVNAQNEDKCTALHFAAEKGHGDVVALLLDRMMEDVGIFAAGLDGWTTLHWAMWDGHGHRDVVALLLGRMEDAGIAVKDLDGWTALHWAVGNGDRDVVALLLHRMEGADVAEKDRWGYRWALDLAEMGGHGHVVALLEKALEKDTTSRIRGNANEDHQS